MTLLRYIPGILHNCIRVPMTKRSSLRAAAREIYGALAKGQVAAPTGSAPDPSARIANAHRSPDGERPLAFGGGVQTDLTARVRALYEDSVVPVREIAQRAGVTERTLYKYVIKHNWKRRYRCATRNEAVASANRGRRLSAAPGFAPVKGAGGRFIRREDAAKPFATGLKATDPAGRAGAEAACGQADALAHAARAQAELGQRRDAVIRAIDATNRALADLNAVCRNADIKRWPSPLQRAAERVAIRQVEVALGRWQGLSASLSAGAAAPCNGSAITA